MLVHTYEELNDFKDKNGNWLCVYTGEPIEEGQLNWDHVIAINRYHVGLNIRGNLCPTTKTANSKKAGKSLEEFYASEWYQNNVSPEKRTILQDKLNSYLKYAQDTPQGQSKLKDKVMIYYYQIIQFLESIDGPIMDELEV